MKTYVTQIEALDAITSAWKALSVQERLDAETAYEAAQMTEDNQNVIGDEDDDGEYRIVVWDGDTDSDSVTDSIGQLYMPEEIWQQTRRTGRPPIGPEVKIRLPKKMINDLQRRARTLGVDRFEVIRRAIADGLDARQMHWSRREHLDQ